MSEKRRRRLKRHESLQPLSRHHMEALHLALKLRRAGTEKSDLTLEELQQELKNFWEPNGQEHFREEEEILLPTYAQYKDINQPEIIVPFVGTDQNRHQHLVLHPSRCLAILRNVTGFPHHQQHFFLYLYLLFE